MSDLIANIKSRVAATDEAQAVLKELKVRGIRVVDAIDSTPGLSDEDKEGLAVVLGGITTMAESIEFCIEAEGSAIGLERAGLIETAKKTIARIDEVIA